MLKETYLCIHIRLVFFHLLSCVFRFFLFLFQEGWCDRVGSVQEIQAKLLKRQEAAAKRERAMAYALANQVRMRGLFFQGHVIGHFVSKF